MAAEMEAEDWRELVGAYLDEPQKPTWTGQLNLPKGAIERARIDFGQKMTPIPGMPQVKAVRREKVRAEFYARHPSDNKDIKRKAFNRLMTSLIPYAHNARTHSAEQVDQIAASIREWGWTVRSSRTSRIAS